MLSGILGAKVLPLSYLPLAADLCKQTPCQYDISYFLVVFLTIAQFKSETHIKIISYQRTIQESCYHGTLNELLHVGFFGTIVNTSKE